MNFLLLIISNFNATTFKPTFLLLHVFMISFLLFLSHGSIAEADKVIMHDTGAIIDVDSRIGREQKIAMNIALHNFNNQSKFHKLSLHFQNSGSDPIRSVHAAEKLIKEKRVQVIIGMETWDEAALVANIGTRAQVPVLSFATAAIAPALVQHRWPFLVQMATDGSEQINCIADIVQTFKWQRVVAIYEEDIHGGDSGKLTLLSKALKKVGSDIDYHLILPPFSCLSNPQEFVNEELSKLESSTKCRVFIFLQSSLPLTIFLFSEVKRMKFMRRESVWIIADTSTASLPNAPVVSTMEGALLIKPYYSKNNKSFAPFHEQFRQKFQSEYPKEENSEPGIHALRAYDSIMTITHAMLVKSTGKLSSSKMLRDSILSSNLAGLSGEVRFEEGRLSSSQKFSIVNIANQGYNNIGFWSSEFRFSDSPSTKKNGEITKKLGGLAEVIWPGDPERIPGGWAPMKIAVPGRVIFKKFLKAELIKDSDVKNFSGFCIRVYEEVKKFLEEPDNIHLPSPKEFHVFDGSYDDLVESVHNKTFDAAIGDITILADRWHLVEFTEPFIESGLLMVVPVKPETSKTWLFLKPFTMEMWVATGAILIYTMFIVWFLEQRSNPEFNGPWKEQLGNVLWFAFSTLFFAHREKIKSNFTRTVVVVWLFVVLILTQSYTASLSSMLTISRLRRTVIKTSNAKVGCNGNAFVKNYLEKNYEFESDNIIPINSEDEYLDAFNNKSISAAFLEVPYAKLFVNQYCKQYEYSNGSLKSRFGGFGFVFQKSSPLASKVSEAILQLSEKGKLKELENELFAPSSECSNPQDTKDYDRLSIQDFSGLFLICAATSTICLLLYLMKRFLINAGTTIPQSVPTSGDQIEML